MNINDLPEVECVECGWCGSSLELDGDYCCPECGSDDIQDYEPDEDEIDEED